MKKSTIKNLKVFACGAIAGTIILTGYNHYEKEKSEKNIIKDFEDKFGTPDTTSSSVETTEKVKEKKYSFDYYGEEFTLQGEDLKVYGFDENGKIYEEKLDEVEVEKPKDNIVSKDYVSELEYNVYTAIQNKDSIESQYNVLLLFDDMNKVCEELLQREDFDGKKERIEYIYNVGYKYAYPDSKYTFAGCRFVDLDHCIQNDIKKILVKIKYIIDNNAIKEENITEEFGDNFSKIINYGLFNRGQ